MFHLSKLIKQEHIAESQLITDIDGTINILCKYTLILCYA